jgi:heterodisulfide reductase subunit A
MIENVLITVKTETEVVDVTGYVGNFTVTLRSSGEEEEVEVSTIILATGMQVLEPRGLCGYDKYDNVITQLEFEKRLAAGKYNDVNTVAMINCVNSRNSERGCCNIGCVTSMKHIKTLKSKKPDSRVFLFYRDLIVPGTESEYCDEAQQEADALIRYAEGALPEVSEAEDGELKVRAHDLLLEEDIEVNADLVVLVTAFSGDESASKLKDLLRVTIGNDNFYQEAHVKLRPVDFASDGIYLAGCGRSPKSVSESVSEALGTAMRASIPMQRGYVESDGLVAEIDAEKCIGCELCSIACAYGALEEYRSTEVPVDRSQSAQQPVNADVEESFGPSARRPAGTRTRLKRFSVIEALCKGCGTCVGGCPEHAITMTNFTDEQIEAQIDALLLKEEKSPEPRAPDPETGPGPLVPGPQKKKPVAFACHWCALGAADLAGVSRFQYPTDTRIVRVMCSGRVDPAFVMRAFAQGAPGVLSAGCEVPTCHYISGNIYAEWRLEMLHMLMDLCQLDRRRLQVEWISAAQGDRFAKIMQEFSVNMNELGPVPQEQLDTLDMRAAVACADSERLRLLTGKLPEMAEQGNEYGEKLTRHELMRILDAAVKDEFMINKIMLQLDQKSMSVKELAVEMNTAPPKVLKSVLGLVREGRVKRDKVEGTTPYYIAIGTALESVSTKETRPVKDNGGVPAAQD